MQLKMPPETQPDSHPTNDRSRECEKQTYFEIKNPDLNYGEFATFRKHKDKYRNIIPPYGIKQQTNNKKIQKNDVCTCIYRFFYVILQRKIKINLLWERY